LQKLKTEYLHVQQDINSNVHPVLVYVVVNSKPIPSGVGHLDLPIPVLSTEDYSPALVYVAGDVTDSQELDLKNLKKGLITLDHKTILGHNVEVKSDVVPPPDNFKR